MCDCIELAKKGAGYVSPNPLVGCVIVKDSKIIGKGYHAAFGKSHAELNAVNDAKNHGHSLENSEVYVNLEPCSHIGKTPPCSDLLIEEKVKRIIIGMKDPNKKIHGIKKLRDAGIDVVKGVLESECKELNKYFIKFISKGIPYVTLKIAQSIDGKIVHPNKKRYITGAESRKYVHKLRSEYDAVLVGTNTVKLDNPLLTVRDVKGRDPLRIILGGRLFFSSKLKVFHDKNYLLLTDTETPDSFNSIHVKSYGGYLDLRDALKKLSGRNITSVLVEGGSQVFSYFIHHKLADEIIVMTAPMLIGKGISAFEDFLSKEYNKSPVKVRPFKLEFIDEDILSIFKCSQE